MSKSKFTKRELYVLSLLVAHQKLEFETRQMKMENRIIGTWREDQIAEYDRYLEREQELNAILKKIKELETT